MSRTLIDLSGMRFGRLVVIERCGYVQKRTKQPTWLCRCDCGSSAIVIGYQMRNGSQKSCGCLRLENSTTHGCTHSPAHQSWRAMRERCNNPNNSHYASYGGRGIRVSKRWDSFVNFLADMGERLSTQSLERIDLDGDYTPSNCKWAVSYEQSRNTSRSVKLTHRGVTKNLCDWAADIGITRSGLRARLKKMSVADALTTKKLGT